MDWTKVKDLIEKSRNVKASTVKSYIGNLKKLFNETSDEKEIDEKDPTKWIDVDKILDFLDSKSPHTIRNFLNTLIVYIELFDDEGSDKLNELKDLHADYRHQIEKAYSSGEKTEKQEKNWTTMAELKKIPRKLKRELDEREAFQKTTLNRSDMNLLQQWVIANLIVGDTETHPPTRLENYSEMKVIEKDKYDNLSKKEKEKYNWLVNTNKKDKKFVFNVYKTSDKYGEVVIPLSKHMNSVMNIWLKFNNKDNDYLLTNYRNNQKMSSNSLGKLISEIFKIKGKEVSLNLIRSIFVSETFPKEASQKQKDVAEKMGHSVAVQNNVYSKKED